MDIQKPTPDPPRRRHNRSILVRLTEGQYQALGEAARLAGETVSAFIRQSVFDRIRGDKRGAFRGLLRRMIDRGDV